LTRPSGLLEDNIGDCDTDEEEDGAVTVLKLSNGVMFRVPVEVHLRTHLFCIGQYFLLFQFYIMIG
jgi:hypothetical protein